MVNGIDMGLEIEEAKAQLTAALVPFTVMPTRERRPIKDQDGFDGKGWEMVGGFALVVADKTGEQGRRAERVIGLMQGTNERRYRRFF